MTKLLINLMKCPKHGWFHGGMHGWVCPECKKEAQSSKARKDGYDSVKELFEDNYHEAPVYETSVNDGTKVNEDGV